MSFDLKHIIKGCLDDDRYAQEALYREFAPLMYKVCKNYARDRDEAMDFLQEGFIAVFKSIENYEFKGSFEGWVKRIIVFKCIDALRRTKRYNEVISDFRVEEEIENASFNIDVEEKSEKVKAIINNLPTKAALILKLFILDGYSHNEIAEMLGISAGTSKSQLNRAKQLVRSEFAKGI